MVNPVANSGEMAVRSPTSWGRGDTHGIRDHANKRERIAATEPSNPVSAEIHGKYKSLFSF
jgi:hypothetical protein